MMYEDRNVPRPSFRDRLEKLIAFIFGTLRYSPPPWLGKMFAKLAPLFTTLRKIYENAISRAKDQKRTNPKRFWIKSGAMGLGLVTILVGIIWYQSRPKPYLIEITGTPPSAMGLYEGAKPSSLEVRFSDSAARLDLVGKAIPSGVKISPLISGDWRWVSDREIRFTPKEDWLVGEKYTVSFDKSLFAAHVKLKDYYYTFSSAPMTVSIQSLTFYQDPKVPADKKISATVRFSHPVSTKDFEKRIELELAEKDSQGKDLKKRDVAFTVNYDRFKGEGYILSERLTLPATDSPLKLIVSKGIRSDRGGPAFNERLENSVNVPGLLSYFKVTSIQPTIVRNEKFEPEQVLVIESTASVTPEEMNPGFSAFLLPVDRPELPGMKAQPKHFWSANEVGPPVLNVSEKLKLEPLPIEHEHAMIHSYRYSAPVGRQIYVKVNKGTKAFGDYILAKDYDQVLTVPQFPTELKIMSEGSLLSLSGKKQISVISRGMKAIQFEVGRVIGTQVNHLITQAGGSFTHPIFKDYQFSEDSIIERFTEERNLASADPQKAQYTSFDFSPYMNKAGVSSRRGLYVMRVHRWSPEHKTTQSPTDHRLILITDLGIIAKRFADGSSEVFVQSIATGSPLAGIAIEVLGKNGVPVITQTTDGEGRAKFPSLSDFKREKSPIAYLARNGNDFSFLPFERNDRELDYSRFDIGGFSTGGEKGKLTAYLFSDRGIYRPGDEARVGLIVRATDLTAPKNLPLEIVVSDPRGLEIFKTRIKTGADGLNDFRYSTQESSLTGTYQVTLYTVKDNERHAQLGFTTIRVEEFEPDKLRISSRLSETKAEGWISPKDLRASVSVQTLFGFPAAGRKVSAHLTLLPALPQFKKYPDFTFLDPVKTDKQFSEPLGDQETNASGQAEFALNLEKFDKATYRLSFLAEGFEAEGGRGIATEAVALVSPLSHFVGFRPDGDLKYVKKDSQRSVELKAIDSSLAPKRLTGLNLSLVEVKYVSSLSKQDDGTFKYLSVKKEIPRSNAVLEIPAAGIKVPLQTGEPGDFALLVVDAEKTVLSRIEYSVTGSANLARSLEKTSLLRLGLDRSDYSTGDEIEIQIVAPFTGAGLITIERDRVYAHKWFRTSTTSSVQTIRVPAGLEGNAYVNVAFTRSLHSPEIYMSPLSYAVAPFSISRDKRKHKIDLEVADKVIPGETLKIRYKTDKPSKLILFGVDEGILQVARYQNPDPLEHFLRKWALTVRTTQILDLVLPEIDMLKERAAPGGGEGSLAGSNLNPFRRKRDQPIAFWSGIIDSSTSWKDYSYQVPDSFSGTIRVIAVAVSESKLGATADSVVSRGPFVISPTVPFFVAPGDEFQISAAVANDVEGSGKDAEVHIELQTGPELEVLGDKKVVAKISEKTEGTARFRLKATERLGSASLKFLASRGETKLARTVDLSVRPPTKYETTLQASILRPGKSGELDVARDSFPHLRKASLTVGYLPLAFAGGLLRYLEDYPYLCTEQQVSRAFPALVLRKFPEFGNSPEKIEKVLTSVLTILQSRQNDEGGFGFWAANSHVSPFQAIYATHFLTEAKEAGYPIPEETLNRALGYLSQLAKGDLSTLAGERNAAYATYLLLRNGNLASRDLTNLYEKVSSNKDKAWRKDLTAVYLAGGYAIIQDAGKARALLSDIKIGEAPPADYANFYDVMVRDAQYLYIVAKHFPDRLSEIKGEDIELAMKPISGNSYNTINSSYAIMALAALADRIPESPALKVTASEILSDGKSHPLNLRQIRFPSAEYRLGAKTIALKNGSERTLFSSAAETAYDKAPPSGSKSEGVEVTRELLDLKGNAIKETVLGEELQVRIAVRGIKQDQWNVAVVDILPGGFEVVRDSIRKAVPVASSSPPSGDEYEGGDTAPPDGEVPQEEMEGEGALLDWLVGIPKAFAEPDNAWQPSYVDIREDRVLLFGDIPTSAKIYSYRIKSINEGKFQLPPVYAEGMYDRAVKGHSTAGGTITVKGK